MDTERVVTINARSRHGLLRKIKSVQIDLNLLSTMFHMRQDNAARALGVSLTSLKIACRRLGLSRWPYSAARVEASGSGESLTEGGEERETSEGTAEMLDGEDEGSSEEQITETSGSHRFGHEEDIVVKSATQDHSAVSAPVLGVAVEGEDTNGNDQDPSKYMDVGDIQVNVQWLGWYMNCDDSSPVFQ
mmetsp:Transcript_10094/g.23020  ORF Transcript_10094/g.23020 Transcript_10094/m.23020 type:complete len:189 (-) Transcript_10094:20-586(-)